MKNNKPNALDQFIIQLATEFAKIPDFEKKMQDDDLKRIHTFISVGILGLHDSVNLVTMSFVPAASKAVANTRNLIQHSMFKEIIATLDYDPNAIQHETIRLGYVFTFHKFEVFINQLMDIMDAASEVPAQSLKKYCKSKFGFNPVEWFRNKHIHVMNFISNCTKHQDGLCRLSNPAYKKPAEFETHPEDQRIVRSTQQYRADSKAMIDAINVLIQVINSIFMYRAIEESVEFLSEGADPMESELFQTIKATMETLVRVSIQAYEL